MARRRYISTKLSLDAKVNKLAMTAGDFAALLYTWMIPHAEDDARLTGDPEELMMMVCPGRRDKTPDDIAAALQAMHDLGLVEWNQEAGYVQFPASFYGYQTYITDKRKGAQNNDPSDTPPQNSAKQRKSPQNPASFSSSVSITSEGDRGREDDQDPFAATGAVTPSPPANQVPVPNPKSRPKKNKSIEPPKPRPVNPHWDALVAVVGYEPAPSQKSAWGKVVKELKEMGAEPGDIPIRAAAYRAKWANMDLTVQALAKHWPSLAPEVVSRTKSAAPPKRAFTRLKPETPSPEVDPVREATGPPTHYHRLKAG